MSCVKLNKLLGLLMLSRSNDIQFIGKTKWDSTWKKKQTLGTTVTNFTFFHFYIYLVTLWKFSFKVIKLGLFWENKYLDIFIFPWQCPISLFCDSGLIYNISQSLCFHIGFQVAFWYKMWDSQEFITSWYCKTELHGFWNAKHCRLPLHSTQD